MFNEVERTSGCSVPRPLSLHIVVDQRFSQHFPFLTEYSTPSLSHSFTLSSPTYFYHAFYTGAVASGNGHLSCDDFGRDGACVWRQLSPPNLNPDSIPDAPDLTCLRLAASASSAPVRRGVWVCGGLFQRSCEADLSLFLTNSSFFFSHDAPYGQDNGQYLLSLLLHCLSFHYRVCKDT